MNHSDIYYIIHINHLTIDAARIVQPIFNLLSYFQICWRLITPCNSDMVKQHVFFTVFRNALGGGRSSCPLFIKFYKNISFPKNRHLKDSSPAELPTPSPRFSLKMIFGSALLPWVMTLPPIVLSPPNWLKPYSIRGSRRRDFQGLNDFVFLCSPSDNPYPIYNYLFSCVHMFQLIPREFQSM